MSESQNRLFDLSTAEKSVAVGAGLTIIGSILPWSTTAQAGSRVGLSSPDGILTACSDRYLGSNVLQRLSKTWGVRRWFHHLSRRHLRYPLSAGDIGA